MIVLLCLLGLVLLGYICLRAITQQVEDERRMNSIATPLQNAGDRGSKSLRDGLGRPAALQVRVAANKKFWHFAKKWTAW